MIPAGTPPTSDLANRLELSGRITELQALRFTPAGIPALDLKLEHRSTRVEAGQARAVHANLNAVAFGVLAERLGRLEIGAQRRFAGFLANARQGKSLVFHIQEFVQD